MGNKHHRNTLQYKTHKPNQFRLRACVLVFLLFVKLRGKEMKNFGVRFPYSKQFARFWKFIVYFHIQ